MEGDWNIAFFFHRIKRSRKFRKFNKPLHSLIVNGQVTNYRGDDSEACNPVLSTAFWCFGGGVGHGFDSYLNLEFGH